MPEVTDSSSCEARVRPHGLEAWYKYLLYVNAVENVLVFKVCHPHFLTRLASWEGKLMSYIVVEI
jgi:hypothetical protein